MFAVEEHAPRCVAENFAVHWRTAAEQITRIGWYPLWTLRATPIAILIADDTRTAVANPQMSRDVSQHRAVALRLRSSAWTAAGNPRYRVYRRY